MGHDNKNETKFWKSRPKYAVSNDLRSGGAYAKDLVIHAIVYGILASYGIPVYFFNYEMGHDNKNETKFWKSRPKYAVSNDLRSGGAYAKDLVIHAIVYGILGHHNHVVLSVYNTQLTFDF